MAKAKATYTRTVTYQLDIPCRGVGNNVDLVLLRDVLNTIDYLEGLVVDCIDSHLDSSTGNYVETWHIVKG